MAEENTDSVFPKNSEPVESALTKGVEQLVEKIDVSDQLKRFADLLGTQP